MILFIVALVAGYLAFIIGKWRHYCVFWDVNAPDNLPRRWHNPATRMGTWLAVTIFSLVFATAIASVISEEINPFLGKFTWGVLLAARWFASLIAANRQAIPELAKREKEIDLSSE